jgi:hypothetical protein
MLFCVKARSVSKQDFSITARLDKLGERLQPNVLHYVVDYLGAPHQRLDVNATAEFHLLKARLIRIPIVFVIVFIFGSSRRVLCVVYRPLKAYTKQRACHAVNTGERAEGRPV